MILRGYPGSGKSTYAQQWLAADPGNRARVNRDEIRKLVFNGEGILDVEQEQMITRIEREIVKQAVADKKSIIVDNMNLRLAYAREWATLAQSLGVDYEVHDITTDVNTCLLRNEVRRQSGGRHVPPEAIRTLGRDFPMPWPEVTPKEPQKAVLGPVEPYVHQDGLPTVAIFDIDGTTALNGGHRGWYEWAKVGGDEPNAYVVDLISVIRPQVDHIVFLSGRDAICRVETLDWLWEHVQKSRKDELFMRTEGDNRADDIVKHELFNEHIRNRYNVRFVVDDRPRVCRLWRAIGLPLLQVGTGEEF